MTFTGKQLFEMGCPQTRIKLLINKEFESEEAARAEFIVEKKEKKVDNPDSIFNFLVKFRHLPMHLNGNSPEKMSNSELRRLLDSGGVRVNGISPKADDSFSFPIWELIFFPNRCPFWYLYCIKQYIDTYGRST